MREFSSYFLIERNFKQKEYQLSLIMTILMLQFISKPCQVVFHLFSILSFSYHVLFGSSGLCHTWNFPFSIGPFKRNEIGHPSNVQIKYLTEVTWASWWYHQSSSFVKKYPQCKFEFYTMSGISKNGKN